MMAWLVMERGVCNLLDLMLNTGSLLKKGESLLLQNCTLKKGQILETKFPVNQSTKVEQLPKALKLN